MSGKAIPKELMSEFAHLLVETMGLHYPKEQWNDLEKKLWRIIYSFGFQDPETCLLWLKKSPLNREKITLLAQHLTIGETYFFRDSRTMTALKEKILPGILESHRMDRKIRIWCAGCCSGEEPYSIAIFLHQVLPNWQNWDIEILGTDINAEFLKKAHIGHYKKWSFRTTPPEIIKKYFIEHADSTYSLIPEIKEIVKFSYLNLVEDTYPTTASHTDHMDLILCHNVLIYFSQLQIKKIIHRFTQALKEHAWLSVSAIEAPFVSDKHLILHQFYGAFFFKKDSRKKAGQEEFCISSYSSPKEMPAAQDDILLKVVLPAFLQTSQSPPSLDIRFSDEKKTSHLAEKIKDKQTSNVSAEESLYEKCLYLSHNKQYKEALSKLLDCLLPYQKDDNIIHQHIKEVILLIQIYANQGDLIHASEWTEIALKADKLNPILYYLQATIFNFLDDTPNCMKSLKKALFLDPNFVVAHYMLGVLEQRQQNKKAALRSFKTALELLQNYQAEDILPGTEELTASYLKDLLT